jgi:hypothetical protein
MRITPKKFLVEDFGKEEQSWIGNLLSPLNNLIQELFIGLNNGLTISDNLFQEIKELKLFNDTTNFPLKFKSKFNKIPAGMVVIYCIDSNGGMPLNFPQPNWSYSNQQITINSISNLTAGLTYTVRFHVIYA